MLLFYIVLLSGCSDTPLTEKAGRLSASILPRQEGIPNASDDYRIHTAIFSIRANSDTGEYRLALRTTPEDAPTAIEIKGSSATIIRNLSIEAINVFMSFDMDTDLFDKDWDTDFAPLDNGLKPGKGYTLYAVKEDGTEVGSLFTFTTGAVPVSGLPYFGAPMGREFIVRKEEPYLLIVGVFNLGSAISIKPKGESDETQCSNIVDFCTPSNNKSKTLYFAVGKNGNPISHSFVMASGIIPGRNTWHHNWLQCQVYLWQAG